MRITIAIFCLALLLLPIATGKTVVFWQEDFPAVATLPISRDVLARAVDDPDTRFANIDALQAPETLAGANLLILPYGSAFPAAAWGAIQGCLRDGGNLLIAGGQALRVPVRLIGGKFVAGPEQDSYSRELGIQHTYIAPEQGAAIFEWRTGYSFLPNTVVRASRFFVLEGRLNGLGYMRNEDGVHVAAPVVVADRQASRVVMLPFEPAAGFWDSADAESLIRATAAYARRGPVSLTLEMPYSTILPGQAPRVVVHLRGAKLESGGDVRVDLVSGDIVLETLRTPCSGTSVNAELAFSKPLAPGFYMVRGVREKDGQGLEAYTNGIWVEDQTMLTTGPRLGVQGDFLSRDGKPFFPVGANYFSTEANGWDFAGPRNAWIWERDFAEMQAHGVNFVRTGVWSLGARQLDPLNKGATERFLRNLEAFLLSARAHNIIVNWTFYAFTPKPVDPTEPQPGAGGRGGRGGAPQGPPRPNVYLDPAAVQAELNYVLSIVTRFKDVPYLCWDLINEPSFSNPDRLWTGNTPNNDPKELDLWHAWLAKRYGSIDSLASAWRVTPESLGRFEDVPLPTIPQLSFARYQNAGMSRAADYNLFAQDGFTGWVRSMVDAIRMAGSQQLINVGQDEGGVTNRLLNQFYASGGVDFTTNHTYWQDDALLWDSVVAKRPGMPNIIGETGYQPVRAADSTWRYDELTGFALNEKKWALGFAAGSSGALMWDWDREVDFGMKRSDGSAKALQTAMRELGRFAEAAAPHATALVPPAVALVLPQSFQLSIYNKSALEAQQRAVRALYYCARGEAYAVGEHQIERLGSPKLIILPSPKGLTASAWEAIRGKVSEGATLLVSGPFDGDPHFHPTGRNLAIGLLYNTVPLSVRHEVLRWPGGQASISFLGEKTTFLDRAALPDGTLWVEKPLGKGRVLFSALPIELNDNEQAVGDVYRYALKLAGVAPTYTTTADSGLLICPTQFPGATLYVLVSETGRREVSFTDRRSGKRFSGALEPGRSALLLVGSNGALLASYNWK